MRLLRTSLASLLLTVFMAGGLLAPEVHRIAHSLEGEASHHDACAIEHAGAVFEPASATTGYTLCLLCTQHVTALSSGTSAHYVVQPEAPLLSLLQNAPPSIAPARRAIRGPPFSV